MEIKIYPSKRYTKDYLVLVGGSGDTCEKFDNLARNISTLLPSKHIVTTTMTETSSLSDTLRAQTDELAQIIDKLITEHDATSIDIFATSMGAYSTCHLLANPKYQNILKKVIFLDPADYYLADNEDIKYAWTGFAKYDPTEEVVSSLLKNIQSDVVVDVVRLSIRNYGPRGYLSNNYSERGRGDLAMYPRLNVQMVKVFYSKLPENNQGKYFELPGVPHGFIRDGDIPQNISKIAEVVSSLLI